MEKEIYSVALPNRTLFKGNNGIEYFVTTEVETGSKRLGHQTIEKTYTKVIRGISKDMEVLVEIYLGPGIIIHYE